MVEVLHACIAIMVSLLPEIKLQPESIVCLGLLCIYACYSGADLESLKRGCTTICMMK